MTEEEKKIKLKYFPIAKEKCPFHNEDLQNGYYEGFLECAKELEQAKEIIKNIIRVTWGEGWNYSLDWKVKAEQFLEE